jgi:hypothetical protein
MFNRIFFVLRGNFIDWYISLLGLTVQIKILKGYMSLARIMNIFTEFSAQTNAYLPRYHVGKNYF